MELTDAFTKVETILPEKSTNCYETEWNTPVKVNWLGVSFNHTIEINTRVIGGLRPTAAHRDVTVMARMQYSMWLTDNIW